MRYEFSVIRFVPDAARGEFVNVGLIVGSEQRDECEVRLAESRRRALNLTGREIVDPLWSYLNDFRNGIRQRSGEWQDFHFSAIWLSRLWSSDRSSLQASPPAPVSADGIKEATESLARQLLPEAKAIRRSRGPTKSTVVAALREAYRESGVERGLNYLEKPLVEGPNHSEVFDFAVVNGRAVQLTQTWNFRQRDLGAVTEAVKAWAWTIQEIRQDGATGRLGRKVFDVPRNVDVEAVYVAPTSKEGKAALHQAVHAFQEVEARVLERDGVESLARRAAKLLGRSAGQPA
jgi:hypothetical protein